MSGKKGVSGTKEWSVASVNCALGCPNSCYYCYAREMAIRFGRVPSVSNWQNNVSIQRQTAKECRMYDGVVMFPTTHDITPNLLQPAYEVLTNLLTVGNDVLIVSKPHLYCVQILCRALVEWTHQIQFRFTISTTDGRIAKMWEPGAPPPVERIACLREAFNAGYRTSVSMEPMLDPKHAVEDFHQFKPCVTEAIWLGKLNHLRKRVVVQQVKSGIVIQEGVTIDEVDRLEAAQSDETIWSIYNALKDEPMARWKESVKKVVGLPLETEAGTDR